MAVAIGGCDDSTHLKREFRIPSPTMEPTVKVGDHVKADLQIYRDEFPQRGDMVVFHPPRGAGDDRCAIAAEPETGIQGRPCERPTPGRSEYTFFKRVVAIPGDWLKIVDNRVLLAKSRAGPFEPQDEPFIATDTPCGELCNLRAPVQVPPRHYYVLGDNRGASDDSRSWGPVPLEDMIGKVVDIEHR